MSLDGHGLKDIAESTGLHPATVYRKRTKSGGLKDIIEAAQQQIIQDNITHVASNISYLIQSYITNDCSTPKARDEKHHAWDATKRMAEMVGIFPAHTQATFIQNIYNDHRTELSPIVAELLRSHNILPDDPIEAELIEDRRL
jgi:AcrR family transcriptional regulator